MKVASRSVDDENALFDEDEETEEDEVVLKRAEGPSNAAEDVQPSKPETSKQRLLSAAKVAPKFEGLRTLAAGHQVQDIKELMTVPVWFNLQVQFCGKSSDNLTFDYRSS